MSTVSEASHGELAALRTQLATVTAEMDRLKSVRSVEGAIRIRNERDEARAEAAGWQQRVRRLEKYITLGSGDYRKLREERDALIGLLAEWLAGPMSDDAADAKLGKRTRAALTPQPAQGRYMSTCEKCWGDAYVMPGAQPDNYRRLLSERTACTPEEQAGTDAERCPACSRRTLHQHTGECMRVRCKYFRPTV